ncbi:hypothetical protein ACKKBG_A23445 [Auxenochlorella protothecoides x Auxenochlorella symbiontica]
MQQSVIQVRDLGSVPVHRPRRGVQVRAQFGPTPQPGDRLLPLLRSPADVLALGPRVALGVLQSFPEALSQLPLDLQRLGSLVQDPRPIDQKQAEVLEVVETRVADYVEKGTALEAGLKAGVASVLPQGIKDAIPATLRESLLGRDTGRGSGDAPASRAEPAAAEKPQSFANNLLQRQQPAPATAPSSNGASAPGLATWTITTDEEDGVARPLSPGADVSGVGDAPPAILAELAEVLQGVGALKSTLLALRTNGDPALGTMSRLNVREAEETLRRRLQQLSAVHAVSAVPDPEVAAAIQEGEALLAESAALTD